MLTKQFGLFLLLVISKIALEMKRLDIFHNAMSRIANLNIQTKNVFILTSPT